MEEAGAYTVIKSHNYTQRTAGKAMGNRIRSMVVPPSASQLGSCNTVLQNATKGGNWVKHTLDLSMLFIYIITTACESMVLSIKTSI